MPAPLYEAITREIRVRVTARFLAAQSRAAAGRYLWSYTIEITNEGREPVQLRSRRWRITDATGQTREIARNEGYQSGGTVVGMTPILQPGASFRYRSGCELRAPSGVMLGTYDFMTIDRRELFNVEVPAFSLDSPHAKRSLN